MVSLQSEPFNENIGTIISFEGKILALNNNNFHEFLTCFDIYSSNVSYVNVIVLSGEIFIKNYNQISKFNY